VTIVQNGKEAVDKALSGSYDAVLMDIQMPEMDGFEATRRIRSSGKEGTDTLPVIAMTAHAMVKDREMSLDAGMNDHVTKPIDPNEFFATLVRWIAPRMYHAEPVPEDETPVPAGEDAMPSFKLVGINSKEALARVGGNAALYTELLRKFKRDFSQSVPDIEKALEEEDSPAVRHLMHTVKGVAGNIGAERLFHAASKLDDAFKENKIENVERLIVN